MKRAKIFVSYRHESEEHRIQVRKLAARLNQDGLPTEIDQNVNGAPDEGWPRWMMNQLERADHVLVVCTETYYRCFRGNEELSKGKGVDWEGALITSAIYEAKSRSNKFVPVVFTLTDRSFVPEPLTKGSCYELSSEEGYLKLYRFLTDQPEFQRTEPGPLKELLTVGEVPLTFDESPVGIVASPLSTAPSDSGGTEIDRLKTQAQRPHGSQFLQSTIQQHGAGAVAVGPGAIAAAPGAVVIGGDNRGQIHVYNESRVVANSDADETLLAAYLDQLTIDCSQLKLKAIDCGLAQPSRQVVELGQVYVDLNLDQRLPRQRSFLSCLEEGDPAGARASVAPGETVKETRLLPALEALAALPRLVVLGAPGSGKSTLTAHVALSLALARRGDTAALGRLGEWWKAGALLPVRLILRTLAEHVQADGKPGNAGQVWNFLANELERRGLTRATADAIRRVAQQSGAMFLLDGLDEARDLTTRTQVLRAVTAFMSSAGPRSRFLLTSRPFAWTGQDTGSDDDPLPTAYRLADFEPEQITVFVTRWFQAVANSGRLSPTEAAAKSRQLTQAVERADLQPLARNPLLLTLMATSLANQARLPDDRFDLYHQVVDLLLRRWNDATGATQGLLRNLGVPALKLDDLRDALQRLAFAAHQGHLGREGSADIPRADVEAILRPLLETQPPDKPETARRLQVVLDYIEERAGLLLGHGAGRYSFPHRTFQEFLAGCHLGDANDFEMQVRALADGHPDHWREPLRFAARRAKASRGVPAADLLVGRTEVAAPDARIVAQEARRAILAAEQLIEIGLPTVKPCDPGDVVRRRVANWLLAALTRSDLPARERATAGNLLDQLGDPRRGVVPVSPDEVGEMEFCWVPGKPVQPQSGAAPGRITYGFWIARYPVTVAQFRQFATASGYSVSRYWPEAQAAGIWNDGRVQDFLDEQPRSGPFRLADPFAPGNHPIIQVNWYEALAYGRWLSERSSDQLPTNLMLGLPSEQEWERAARGGIMIPQPALVRRLSQGLTVPPESTVGSNSAPRREYPWPGEFDFERGNTRETGIGATNAVGAFPTGSSPVGAEEMAGNVWEWTRSPFQGGEGPDTGEIMSRVIRGGSWDYRAGSARCAIRNDNAPDNRLPNLGFRLAASPVADPGV